MDRSLLKDEDNNLDDYNNDNKRSKVNCISLNLSITYCTDFCEGQISILFLGYSILSLIFQYNHVLVLWN